MTIFAIHITDTLTQIYMHTPDIVLNNQFDSGDGGGGGHLFGHGCSWSVVNSILYAKAVVRFLATLLVVFFFIDSFIFEFITGVDSRLGKCAATATAIQGRVCSNGRKKYNK